MINEFAALIICASHASHSTKIEANHAHLRTSGPKKTYFRNG